MLLHPVRPVERPAVTRVVLVGTLNDVQGIAGSEVLHVVWENGSQGLEQRELLQLVRHRVIVTIELSEVGPEPSQG